MRSILSILCLSTILWTTLWLLMVNDGVHSTRLSRIKLRGKWFVDELDRVVILRGTNAVEKRPPWIPNIKHNDLTNSSQVRNLRDWGFNVVRVGVMWSGVMPERDVINQTYLDEMSKIVDSLADNGIYVIVDLHQDMLSSRFMSYDGVPAWLIDSLPSSRSEFPWPLKHKTIKESIFAAYLTESCGFAFQCLYDNRNKFADYFELYWTVVAKAFAGRTNVLAYELLNEPWAGDVYSNPLLFMSGMAGRVNLMPLYDRAYEAIRKYDNDTLVFYEPVTWGVMLNHQYLGTGFTRPPGNDRNRTVLSWHYYCWLLQFVKNPLRDGKYSLLQRVVCGQLQLESSFESIRLDTLALGDGPSFLTEFGVCAFPKPSNDSSLPTTYNTEECERILQTADKHIQSWAYWDSDFYDPRTLQLNSEIVRVFSRVYPFAINGSPKKVFFNSTTSEFLLEFKMTVTNTREAKTPTEIFIPQHVYGSSGFDVKLSSNLAWAYDSKLNRVYIVLIDSIVKKFDEDKEFVFEQDMVVSITSKL